jgi:hypothetical protein
MGPQAALVCPVRLIMALALPTFEKKDLMDLLSAISVIIIRSVLKTYIVII